jgi:hypothetical protein
LQDIRHHLVVLRSLLGRVGCYCPLLGCLWDAAVSRGSFSSKVSELPGFGGSCLIVGAIFIAIAAFAYSRHISAMIVGCLIWTFSLAVIHGDSSMFGLTNNVIDSYRCNFTAPLAIPSLIRASGSPKSATCSHKFGSKPAVIRKRSELLRGSEISLWAGSTPGHCKSTSRVVETARQTNPDDCLLFGRMS